MRSSGPTLGDCGAAASAKLSEKPSSTQAAILGPGSARPDRAGGIWATCVRAATDRGSGGAVVERRVGAFSHVFKALLGVLIRGELEILEVCAVARSRLVAASTAGRLGGLGG